MTFTLVVKLTQKHDLVCEELLKFIPELQQVNM